MNEHIYPKSDFNMEALLAYKEQRPKVLKEIPTYTREGELLVMKAKDYGMIWKAFRGHFKTVQLTKKGNFSARLPLERRLNRMLRSCHVLLVKSSGGHYHVLKDYGGKFFNHQPISLQQVNDTFGVHEFVKWKFPRKVKKEYRRFAAIGEQLEKQMP